MDRLERVEIMWSPGSRRGRMWTAAAGLLVVFVAFEAAMLWLAAEPHAGPELDLPDGRVVDARSGELPGIYWRLSSEMKTEFLHLGEGGSALWFEHEGEDFCLGPVRREHEGRWSSLPGAVSIAWKETGGSDEIRFETIAWNHGLALRDDREDVWARR
jgi:hypothetical protein